MNFVSYYIYIGIYSILYKGGIFLRLAQKIAISLLCCVMAVSGIITPAMAKPDTTPELSTSISYPEVSLNQLINSASLIVVGSIISSPDVLLVKHSDGSTVNKFHNYTLKIQNVIYSETKQIQNTLHIRTECNGGSNDICSYLSDAEYQKDKVYFLLKPTTGGKYITQCDYYLLPFSSASVYNIDSSGKNFYNCNTKISFSELNSALAAKPVSTIEYMDTQVQQMFDSNFISSATYMQLLEEEQHYASVVEGDCGCENILISPYSQGSHTVKHMEHTELSVDIKKQTEVENYFKKFFSNPLQSLCYENSDEESKTYEGVLSVKLMEFAEYKNVVVYEYNQQKNTYRQIPSNIIISASGKSYVEFNKPSNANCFIVSIGNLTKKSS